MQLRRAPALTATGRTAAGRTSWSYHRSFSNAAEYFQPSASLSATTTGCHGTISSFANTSWSFGRAPPPTGASVSGHGAASARVRPKHGGASLHAWLRRGVDVHGGGSTGRCVRAKTR